ncbi:MAG: hypothetical protein AAGD05_10950 [Bacteroidota bacterium]
MMRLLYSIFKFLFLLIFPFIALIRGAVYFHDHQWLSPWLAIAGGIGVTTVLLLVYLTFLHGRLTGHLGDAQSWKRRLLIALLLVFGYSAYGLIFLSGNNTKHDAIQKEYHSLHPILRLGISTILFIDRDLLLTDAKRQPEDYQKMGLPTKKRSLHYPQSNGFVHAVDIRTKGRSEVRNFLLKTYFQLMGFNTLRHVGTADHLHISLGSHDHPDAI